MMQPVVQRLNKEDVRIAAAFKAVVLQGKFELRGDAMAMAGSLFRWLDNLDKRIEESLKPQAPALQIEGPKQGKKK